MKIYAQRTVIYNGQLFQAGDALSLRSKDDAERLLGKRRGLWGEKPPVADAPSLEGDAGSSHGDETGEE